VQNKLEKQREKLKNSLPEWERIARGTLREVYAPCGKKKCKCKQGALHGPYYYLAVTTRGKTKLYYLPKKQLAEETEKAIEEYNQLWEILCKISEINIKLLIERNKKRKRSNGKTSSS
jgi:hypothetical protein